MRVIFEGRRATGIEVCTTKDRGRTRVVQLRAKQEVILSAGAVATPQLLMLSGVGPVRHLAEFNIETVADLPVGQHLQDHLGVFLRYTSLKPVTVSEVTAESRTNLLKYLLMGRGPFTSSL